MSDFNAPQVGQEMGIEELRGIVARLIKEVQFLMDGNLSSTNAREFGGWRIGMVELVSKDKDVGMSTDDSGEDPIRFWAGDLITGKPVFYVSKSGKLYAANGEFAGKITAKSGTIGGFTINETKLSGAGVIEGGTLRSGPTDTAHLEISGGQFKGVTETGELTGLYFDISTIPLTGLADLFLYHNNAKLVRFYDGITYYAIEPGPDATGLRLGGPSAPTYARGTWDFTGSTIQGTIPGNCTSANYAASSGTATEVPSTGIEPGTYTKATYAADGRATSGSSLITSDLPSGIPATKIAAGAVDDNKFQLLAAVTGAIWNDGNSTGNQANNGHVKLPNGLILQWLTYTVPSQQFNGGSIYSFPLTFPIPFPNNCFSSFGSMAGGNITNGYINDTYESQSKTGVNAVVVYSVTTTGSPTFRVFAVGN